MRVKQKLDRHQQRFYYRFLLQANPSYHRSNSVNGFTLIELLVVIIIIGILAAIALPSFLSQSAKAKQSEAKQYLGATMRAQQVYYLEHSEFTNDYVDLELGVPERTDRYDYALLLFNNRQNLAGDTVNGVRITATPRDDIVRGYRAKVWLEPGGPGVTPGIYGVLCEGEPGNVPNMNNRTYCP